MTPKHIWLITGYAGSGKDTTANILADLLTDVATSSFASAVKDDVASMYNFNRAHLDTQEGKAQKICLPTGCKTVREILIEHAEATKTVTHQGIWAERLIAKNPSVTHWILSDWRFIEELIVLRSRFPCARIHTLRVKRPSIIPSESYTERQLDDYIYEYTIENTGSILYIANQLKTILDNI